jgi:hypothetical protein
MWYPVDTYWYTVRVRCLNTITDLDRGPCLRGLLTSRFDTEKVILRRVDALQFAATCCSCSKEGNYYEKSRMRGNISWCYRSDIRLTNFTFMWPLIVTNFFVIKPTRWTNFLNLFWKWNSTCFGQFLCPSSGVIHCTLSNGICHTGL